MRDRKPAVLWHKIVWGKFDFTGFEKITWLAMRDRLMTKVRLKIMGLCNNVTCVLCNKADESVHHLFFECDFSQLIWRKLTDDQVPALTKVKRSYSPLRPLPLSRLTSALNQ